MAIVIILTGCTSVQTVQEESPEPLELPKEIEQTEQQEPLEESDVFITLLSPNNELSIVRKPGAIDFSYINPENMTELPKYNPSSEMLWQVDLRSSNLTNIDMRENFGDLIYADFDSKTQWSDKLPDGYDPELIMEFGKSPGLGVRELHKKGITGKGIGVAIIDQSLLVEHVEYKDQLKLYEEIHSYDEDASMHGPAVASIAVGKTVGVAPEADLYYIAETHGDFNSQGEFEWDLTWIAKSIDRIVEINKTLPGEEKIRVISISLGIGGMFSGSEIAMEAVEKAREEGIYTVYVGSNPFMGLGRNPLNKADDITSFTKGEFWKNQYYNNKELLVPMDSRSTASPTGDDDYVFYRKGGLSWTVPYIAGLYALACQVNPNITPEIFWEEALNTSDTITVNNGKKEESLGKIVNPVRLIEKIEELK